MYLLFWLIVYFVGKLFKTERFGFTAGPLYMIYRTVKFNSFLEKMASKKRFWRIIWNIGVVVGFGQICFILLNLLKNLIFFIIGSNQATPITVLVPGITISWQTLPYILFSLIVVIISHEVAHGIASVADGIPIKSSGMLFAVVIPGAFVEVDEEELKKTEEIKQLRIFAAGSFSNIVLGMFAIILIANFSITISPFYTTAPQGIIVTGLTEGGAAEKIGMERWDVIYSINTTRIHNVEDLMQYMNKVSPGDHILMDTDRGEVVLQTQPHSANSSRAMIGISPFNYFPPKTEHLSKSAPYHLYFTEYWLNALLIGIALINMLPLHPLDGGRYLYSLLKLLKVKRSEQIGNLISIFSLSILALNILLTFTTFGFQRI